MVVAEDEQAEEPESVTVGDLYRQARDHAATECDYDIQGNLDRLSAWMHRGDADAPGPGASRSRGRGLVAEVARRAHFAAHETVYKKFRAEWEGPIARWAGSDEAIKPRDALIAEAKIVSFWAYREGVLQIAGKFDMTLAEVAEAYLRALAAWASDNMPLAACRPAGAPACVAEDMEAIAALWTQRYHGPLRTGPRNLEEDPGTGKAEQLGKLAQAMVTSILEDPTINPAGAFDAVRDALATLLAEPADPLADQLSRAAAQLSDRLLHQAPGDPVLTPEQTRHLLTVLTGLSGLLAANTGASGGSRRNSREDGVIHGSGK
jgi:hypothetical protein